MAEDNVVLEVPSAEEIAQHYKAMGDSVTLINDIINNQAMVEESTEEKHDCVDRNVKHLEIMLAKDFWTSEDMTAVNAAVTAGKEYIA